MTQQLGIVGYPLKHTLSPAFQQAALDACGIDARYEVWETPPERLADRVQELRASGVLGFNVTVPHKETVRALLDDQNDWARHLGAVNTVVNKNGKLTGYNTDADGFLRALRLDAGFNTRGATVLVLGAGGSARAVALTLAHEKVRSITIANRTVERAQALVNALKGLVPYAGAIPMDEAQLRAQARSKASPDLIVNCTTMGMVHGLAEGQSPMSADLIPSKALVYDLVYNPAITPLLRAAQEAGARTLGGLPMLVYQGAVAFTLWTDKEAPVALMTQTARKALGLAG
ncbi:MAG: shikimate dehydrogenase [Dehalococcoidia bacterium]|nr:shikimate dehydrogenase [Dehalococcoidia bacterium]